MGAVKQVHELATFVMELCVGTDQRVPPPAAPQQSVPLERLSSTTDSAALFPTHNQQLLAQNLNPDQTALVSEAYTKQYMVDDEPGTVRRLLRVLYQHVNPAEVSKVDTILDRYAGQEVF